MVTYTECQTLHNIFHGCASEMFYQHYSQITYSFKWYSQSILSCIVAVAGLPTPFIAMHWYIPAKCLVCAWNRKIGRLSTSCISSPYRYNKFLLQCLQWFHVSRITFWPFMIFTRYKFVLLKAVTLLILITFAYQRGIMSLVLHSYET